MAGDPGARIFEVGQVVGKAMRRRKGESATRSTRQTELPK